MEVCSSTSLHVLQLGLLKSIRTIHLDILDLCLEASVTSSLETFDGVSCTFKNNFESASTRGLRLRMFRIPAVLQMLYPPQNYIHFFTARYPRNYTTQAGIKQGS